MRLVRRDPDTAYIDRWLWVPKKFMNVEGTKSALQFTFFDAYNEDRVREVRLWKEAPNHLLLPRCFWDISRLPYRVVDLRPQRYKHVDIRSRIKLDHRWRTIDGVEQLMPDGKVVQRKSYEAIMASTGGLLQLACGKGKTPTALEVAAARAVPTLIIIPDTTLLEQWKVEIEALLDVPEGVGLIQGSKMDWEKPVVLTTYHTIGLRAENLPEYIRRYYGTIIWDEGHHVTAPMFAPSADAFYGFRLLLTATPERADGTHIIARYHIGGVLYKDLSQDLEIDIVFRWTGLELPDPPPEDVLDKNGEVHLSKLSSFFGVWEECRNSLLEDVAYAYQAGRRILVICNSEGELCNLAALWDAMMTQSQEPSLFTDIPAPRLEDVGELPIEVPIELEKEERVRLELRLKELDEQLEQATTELERLKLNSLRYTVSEPLRRDNIRRKLEAELAKRQKVYVKALSERLQQTGSCGIMVHKVPPKMRHQFVKDCRVVFAIRKYGREGLDAPLLDTVFVSTAFADKNVLQQVMGRPTRDKDGKKKPLLVFYEHNIGQIIGMCRKLRQWLREWPHEDGGPFDFEQVGHPTSRKGPWETNRTRIFGQ